MDAVVNLEVDDAVECAVDSGWIWSCDVLSEERLFPMVLFKAEESAWCWRGEEVFAEVDGCCKVAKSFTRASANPSLSDAISVSIFH